METFWKVAVTIAGIGGVGSFVIWSLYRQWLRLDIFQRMTTKQQFTIFVLFLSFTFLFGIAALAAYVVVNADEKPAPVKARDNPPTDTPKNANSKKDAPPNSHEVAPVVEPAPKEQTGTNPKVEPQREPASIEIRLQSITVRFTLPKGDNKDDNTRLGITVRSGAVAIAQKANFADSEEFNDPGNYGPYPLEVQTSVTKAAYRGSTTTLTITPQGGARHDTIIMNTIVEAKFSDGMVLTSESGTLKTVNAATTVFQNP